VDYTGINNMATTQDINNYTYTISNAIVDYGTKLANEIKTNGLHKMRVKELKYKLLIQYLEIVFTYVNQHEFTDAEYDVFTANPNTHILGVSFTNATETYVVDNKLYATYKRELVGAADRYTILLYKYPTMDIPYMGGVYVHNALAPETHYPMGVGCIHDINSPFTGIIDLKFDGYGGTSFPYNTIQSTTITFSRSNNSLSFNNNIFTISEFEDIMRHINRILNTNYWLNLK
jgi:hypothetical protein